MPGAVQSGIEDLAQETLALIFQYVCPPFDLSEIVQDHKADLKSGKKPHPRNPGTHILLSAVCPQWRCIVWSTPRLWTSIFIYIEEDTPSESTAAHLGLHLAKSGVLPLSVEVNFPRQCGWSSDEKASRRFIFEKIAPRVETLVLFNICGPAEFEFLHPIPSLKNLALLSRLRARSWRFPELNLMNLPALDRLVIETGKSCTNFEVKLPPSITYLDFMGASPPNFAQVLLQCRNLVEYYSHSSMVDEKANPDALFPKPLELLSLKSLEWPAFFRGPFSKILLKLRMPVLETLIMHYCSPFYLPVWQDVLHGVSRTLVRLHLCTFSSNWGEYLCIPLNDIFEHTPCVEELELRSCCMKFMINVRESLMLQETGPAGERTPRYLPKLRSLTIQHRYLTEHYGWGRELKKLLEDIVKVRVIDSRRVPAYKLRMCEELMDGGLYDEIGIDILLD